MDKFLVRIIALVVNIYIPISLVFAVNGILITEYDYLFSDTLPLGILLTVLVHTQGRYHCKWIRALCYNSIATPAVCFADAQFSLIESPILFIYIIALLWSLSVITTIVFAISHFVKVRILFSRNRYEKLRSIKQGSKRKSS